MSLSSKTLVESLKRDCKLSFSNQTSVDSLERDSKLRLPYKTLSSPGDAFRVESLKRDFGRIAQGRLEVDSPGVNFSRIPWEKN